MTKNKRFEIVYNLEKIDPTTGKRYRVEIRSTLAQTGALKGLICCEIYLADFDPYHHLQVGLGRKAFFPDEVETEKEMLAELEKIVQAALATGIERFEKIISMG